MRDVHGQIIGLQNDNVSATTHPPARLLPDVLRCRQGMLHIPIFDFSKPAAVTLFLDFHRRLIAQGLVDGTFSDKPNERAFQNASNSLWYICENPHGPSPQHSWADACGEISEATALAYNAGKERMLRELVGLYGTEGALWPVCSAGVEQCGSVCSRTATVSAATAGFGRRLLSRL